MADNQYFKAALSDFVHDMASTGAIRHLVDSGYSLKQIAQALTYPEKLPHIQKVTARYMAESGLLVYSEGYCRKDPLPVPGVPDPSNVSEEADPLQFPGEAGALQLSEGSDPLPWPKEWLTAHPREAFHTVSTAGRTLSQITDLLFKETSSNGEETAYIACPFGLWPAASLRESLSFLSGRELDYIEGLIWEHKPAFHRLTRRMREISAKLLYNRLPGVEAIFLNNKKIISL